MFDGTVSYIYTSLLLPFFRFFNLFLFRELNQIHLRLIN